MGVIIGVIAALAAGHSLAAIVAAFGISQWLAVGELAATGIGAEAKLARLILKHHPTSGHGLQRHRRAGESPAAIIYYGVCFQGAPSGQAARICEVRQ